MISDSVLWIVVIFIFAITGIIVTYVMNELKTTYDEGEMLGANASEIFNEEVSSLPKWVDGAILFIAIVLWAGMIIAARLIDTFPGFFIIMIIVAIAFVLLGMLLSNEWEDYTLDDTFLSTRNSLPITNFLLNNLGKYAFVIIVSIGIALYTKKDEL